MKKKLVAIGATAVAMLTVAGAANMTGSFSPGSRIVILSHNAYPDHGKYADRLERAIAAGLPFATEQDLAWIDGKSLEIHGAKNASGDDPTLRLISSPR